MSKDTFIVNRLYSATVRGVPNVLVSPPRFHKKWWASLTDVNAAYLHHEREVTHVRGPLYVLDPATVGYKMDQVADALEILGYLDLAGQVRVQLLEPGRMREPRWGSSVMASSVYTDMREPWIRWTRDPEEPNQWRNEGGKVTSWAELRKPEMGGSGQGSND